MTISHQIQRTDNDIRIEYRGQFCAEDELREELWLVNMELRNGLPKREQAEAKRQIAGIEERLNVLRETWPSAGA